MMIYAENDGARSRKSLCKPAYTRCSSAGPVRQEHYREAFEFPVERRARRDRAHDKRRATRRSGHPPLNSVILCRIPGGPAKGTRSVTRPVQSILILNKALAESDLVSWHSGHPRDMSNWVFAKYSGQKEDRTTLGRIKSACLSCISKFAIGRDKTLRITRRYEGAP